MTVGTRNFLCAVEIETTEGTDEIAGSPTAFLNVLSCEVVPVRQRVSNNVVRGVASPAASKTYASHCTVTITGYLDGATAGDPPAYDPLLQASGHSIAVDAGVSVTYKPQTAQAKTVTVYLYHRADDGQYRLFSSTGVRGNFSINLETGSAPTYTFEGVGQYVAPGASLIAGPTLPNVYGGGKQLLCADGMTFSVGGSSFAIEGMDLATNWSVEEIRTLTGSSQLDAVKLIRGDDSHIGGGLNFVYTSDFESVLTKHGVDTEFLLSGAITDGTDTVTLSAPKVQFDQWSMNAGNTSRYSVPYMCNGDFGSEPGDNDYTLVYT